MFLIGFPLLVIPLALYNMIAFLTPGLSWTQDIAQFQMMSGGLWTLTPSDLLIAISILILFVEILKSARLSARTIVDHLLAIVLFVGMLAEFLLVRQAASGTFFVLLVIAFVDVAAGFTITIRVAPRRIAAEAAVDGAEKVEQDSK